MTLKTKGSRQFINTSGLTCIQNLDDAWGLFNVQGDVIKPAILHQEHVDIQAVAQGTLSVRLESAGLIRVILGPEPVSKVVIQKTAGGEWRGLGWMECYS